MDMRTVAQFRGVLVDVEELKEVIEELRSELTELRGEVEDLGRKRAAKRRSGPVSLGGNGSDRR